MFGVYSYEAVTVSDLNPIYYAPELVQRNPYLRDSLLLGEGGHRTISKITPSFVHNTVDNPIFPNTGKRLTAAIDLAMLGGNTQFYKPTLEALKFWRHTTRTSFGVRGQFQFIAPVGQTDTLPIFEKLFLGGEYSVRGFDIRSIGPSDPFTGLVLGGNKSFLFNAEYMFSIVSQVRLIAFYDAGQVADDREPFAIDKFRTSTGAEVRFFMPVLNVPFRLIFAANPQREGVLDNNLRPAKKFVFRFAVGTTF
jgi:outer membrane protein insertion porin family